MRSYDTTQWTTLGAAESLSGDDKRALSRRRLAAFRLLSPIERPQGRRLRVLVYARYSSEEQNRRSIDDQYAYCIAFLETLGFDVDVQFLCDEALSGELRERPGIDEVRRGIKERRWDLIVCEDSSREYRVVQYSLELVGSAVDADIRVICLDDDADTAEDDWMERLGERTVA